MEAERAKMSAIVAAATLVVLLLAALMSMIVENATWLSIWFDDLISGRL